MRICSFLPSGTEILYALGLGDSVAGVSYECDFPLEARQKPVVVHSRLPKKTRSAEIDRQVREYVDAGETLYRVDMEELERLAPDLVVTQDLCHVCAASPGDLGSALARLPRPPQVLSLSPRTLTEVFGDIRRVGQAAGRTEAAAQLVDGLEVSVAQIEKGIPSASRRPGVLCLEWLDPPYIGGHWVPEMVERAGATDVLGRAGEPSRRSTWEEIFASQPDVIVVMPCGYDLRQTVAEFRRTEFPDDWAELPAVEAGRVFAVDARSYFSRPGPRLVTGHALLAHLFHPAQVSFSPPPDSLLRL